jgi:hypothetical protein
MSTATVFPNLAATAKREVPLAALLEDITTPKLYATKQACPLASLARFGDLRTKEDCLRSDDNVEAITGLVGDHDDGTLSIEAARDALGLFGIRATLHTTASHTPDAPRWHVLAPLSREYPKAEHTRLMARLNGALSGKLSKESFTLSQSFYFGAVQGAPYQVLHTEGLCIDELPELDDFALGKDGPPKPGDGEHPTHKPSDEELRDLIRRGVARRIYTALLSLTARLAQHGKSAELSSPTSAHSCAMPHGRPST